MGEELAHPAAEQQNRNEREQHVIQRAQRMRRAGLGRRFACSARNGRRQALAIRKYSPDQADENDRHDPVAQYNSPGRPIV